MNRLLTFTVGVLALVAAVGAQARNIGDVVACGEAYGDSSQCQVIECPKEYKPFLGAWSGPMESLVDFGPNPQYRKYTNTVTYSPSDCLKNLSNGDIFIIGRQTDDYPATDKLKAEKKEALLITGKKFTEQKPQGELFLKTVSLKGDEKPMTYALVHKNETAVLSIWRTEGVQDGNPYVVETIDAKDWTVKDPELMNKRNVTITLDSSGFRRVLVRGFHTKQ